MNLATGREPPSAFATRPTTAQYLRAVRADLADFLLPRTEDEKARIVIDMADAVLTHLIAREEEGAGQLGRYVGALPETDAASGADRGIAAIEAAVGAGGSFGAVAEADALRAEQQWYLDTIAAETRLRAPSAEADGEAITLAALTAYLQEQAPAGRDVAAARLVTTLGGNSKNTAIVELSGQDRPADRIVIRSDVLDGPFDVAAAAEFGVLRALFDAGVPVAEPLYVEPTGKVIGAGFIASRFVAGAPGANLSTDVTDGGDPRVAIAALARVLAQVHAVDVPALSLGVEGADRPAAWHVGQLIAQYEAQWLERRTWYSPAMAIGFAWLRRNIHLAGPEVAIVHGDASVRNLMMAGDRPTALIDWETWHLGDPAEDVAYVHDEIRPYMPLAEFIDLYRAAGGRAFDPARLRYWEVWRHLRNSVTSACMIGGVVKGTRQNLISAYSSVRWYRYTVLQLIEKLLDAGADPAALDLEVAAHG